MMRTRLSHEDLKVIFDCVANNEMPPSDLGFKVIRLPLQNSKISPPPFEFVDGIYVLLKAIDRVQADVPSALSEMELSTVGLATCHWRSSGMKSHRSNASAKYLLRYCYPQSENYMNRKGCTIWTRREEVSGIEDLTVRVMHIYPVNKRPYKGLFERSTKKQSVGRGLTNVPLKSTNEDGIHADLMKGELILTPVRDSPVIPNIPVDPGSLFDSDDEDDSRSPGQKSDVCTPKLEQEPIVSQQRTQKPKSTTSRISMSPKADFSPKADIQSFAGKIHSIAKDVYLSKKEDQVRMIHMLQEQLNVLSIAVESDRSETDTKSEDIVAKVKTDHT